MKYTVRAAMTAIVLVLLSFASVSAQDGNPTYVLVHGAFQDASTWNFVVSELETAGETVVTVNLPGRGDDTTPLAELTLDAYRDTVIETVEAQDVPVVLVGHSFGGIVISAVAEAIPDQIDTLIYVTAFLPQSGDSFASLGEADRFTALNQEGSLIIAEDYSTVGVNPDVFATVFCPDCDSDQATTVAASQLDESFAPAVATLDLTSANFGSIPKVYIMAAQDLVVSPQLQAFMLSRTPVDQVYALNTGHAPYITAPDALAELLIDAIQ